MKKRKNVTPTLNTLNTFNTLNRNIKNVKNLLISEHIIVTKLVCLTFCIKNYQA